jgi:hypothetical protein
LIEDIFARLEADLENEIPETIEVLADPENELPKFPPASAITMMTFNYFDNGPDLKQTWSSSRYVMNVQVFTHDKPFTPSRALAVWEGAVQLHDPDFFDRYTDYYWSEHSGCITPEQVASYRKIIRETADMPKVEEGPLLGQFWTKSHGWEYHWGSLIRVRYNQFGEFECDVFHDGASYRVEHFEVVPHENDKLLPVMRGRHDPHKLWRKAPAKRSRKGGR